MPAAPIVTDITIDPNRLEIFGFSILSGFTITLCSLMEVQEAVAPLKVRKAKGAEGSRGDNRPGYSEGYVELRRKDLPAFRVEQCASLHGLPFSVQLTTGALLSFSRFPENSWGAIERRTDGVPVERPRLVFGQVEAKRAQHLHDALRVV